MHGTNINLKQFLRGILYYTYYSQNITPHKNKKYITDMHNEIFKKTLHFTLSTMIRGNKLLTWYSLKMLTLALHTDCASAEIQQQAFPSICHRLQTRSEDSVHLPRNFHSQYSADVTSNLQNNILKLKYIIMNGWMST